MTNILKLRQLAGLEVPTVYEYAKRKAALIKEAQDLTEDQWNKIESPYKGIINGVKHFIVYENNGFALVPVNAQFIGKIDNLPKPKEMGDVSTETAKDETHSMGSNDANDKSEKLIAAVQSGNRITDTSQTTNDSMVANDNNSSELGSEKPKELDVNDHAPEEPKKVKESAEDIAKKIITAVKGGNHPHNAKNSGDTKATDYKGVDYNEMIDDGDAVSNTRNSDSMTKKVKNDKTGQAEQSGEKVDIPESVMKQIEQRINELRDAQKFEDNKGYNDQSVKQNAIEFLEKVKEHLSLKNIDGFAKAQILHGTLMSPITDLLPAGLTLFLATGRNKMNTSGTAAEVP